MKLEIKNGTAYLGDCLEGSLRECQQEMDLHGEGREIFPSRNRKSQEP